MDSKSQLDYALFQLTPTRTRCDLVICAGDCKEKLASGLLAPFIAHLKFAKDEISKGGYSITLSASASWFTKSTLERFVRFVSTPEVLERSITIEREITNIESSLNTNTPSDSQTVYGLEEHSNKSSYIPYMHEDNTDDALALHEEDSKVHLQRVLETRKAVLQKEQAMVYARALIAGFETNNLEDLIYFSDTFGSPRLREACVNFMELCITKSNDRVWMDEVAAMQAYSRSQNSYIETSDTIIFPEEDDPSLNNVQNGNFATKKHNISTYHGNPMFHLPYQGYPFPQMVIPPYYQQNPPFQDFKKRGKHSQKKESQDGEFDSSDSSSESETRSSSKKIVIRNINYMNSEKNGEIEHKYDDNLTNEGQKVTQQWDIFQNLLMKDSDEKESEEFVSRKFEEPNINPSGRHKEGDWFLRSLQDKTVNEKSKDIFEDHFESSESTKDVLVDDSLAIQDRSLNKSSESHLRTQDILIVSDNMTQNSSNRNVNEPNDLYIVLERETAGKQTMPTWTPEMEFGNNDVKIIKLDNKKSTKSTPTKGSTTERKSKALSERKNKSDIVSRSKKPIKGKSDQEEEKRKKMEELRIQRQKRIAERSASTNKSKSQLPNQDMKKSNKRVIKSSTINRLSTARVINPKVLPSESRPVYKPIKMATKKIDESKPTKMVTKKITESKPAKMVTKKITESKPAKMVTKKIDETKRAKMVTKKIIESKSPKMVSKKIVESKPAKMATKNIDLKNSKEPKMENMKQVMKTSSSVVQEDKDIPVNNGGLTKKSLNTVTFKINEDRGVKEKSDVKLNQEISMIKSPERNNSRKKWSSFETSSKALSSFKKLLSFGRRR